VKGFCLRLSNQLDSNDEEELLFFVLFVFEVVFDVVLLDLMDGEEVDSKLKAD
jgi:hypothetical protein